MKYLGVASAVGVPCDVPLVLRSLANSLAFLTPAEFPIPIDKDFLSWLGASFYVRIPEHAMDWWSSKAARKLQGHYLHEGTMDVCLDIFRKHKPTHGTACSTHPPTSNCLQSDALGAVRFEQCIFI